MRDVQRNISWHTVTTPSGSFLFAVVRDVQRNWTSKSVIGHKEWTSQVSIRCRARRTAELGSPAGLGCRDEFLFAVVRDVQRNTRAAGPQPIRLATFLFAVVRDVQRNAAVAGHGRDRHHGEFLFAVVRDVQRNFRRVMGK